MEDSVGLGPNMRHPAAAIASVTVAVAEPSADPRTPAAAAVLDDLAVGFATATTINLRVCDRGLFPVSFSMVGTVSGALTRQCYRDSNGRGCDIKKK